MTDRRDFITSTLALAAAALAGCATPAGGGWVTLIDGSTGKLNLADWVQLGAGNWSVVDGAIQGQNGKAGFLVSKQDYADFEIRAEFWADEDCNSGIFIRCADRNKVGADNSYEVNIFDKRPDPTYGTAAIVDVAKIPQPGPKAANRWNSFDIKAQGERLVVVFNGVQTVDVTDRKFKSGPIALQSAAGTIRFRKLQIRTL